MAFLVRGGRERLVSWVTRSSPRLPFLPHSCRPPVPLPSPYPCCSHYYHRQLRPASTSSVSQNSTTIKREGKTAEHRVTRVVPFTCEQLFDVVVDVDKYKLFLPYCTQSKVLRRIPPNFILAQLLVGFNNVLNERYTSRIRVERPKSIVIAALDSHIFTRLESTWQFQPGPAFAAEMSSSSSSSSSTHVDFRVRFEVSNPLTQAAIDLIFADLVERQIHAFEDRCFAVYGEGIEGGKMRKKIGEEEKEASASDLKR
ncbi:hypothetical protein VYU27_008310 [Nannochloropsis oceanica]